MEGKVLRDDQWERLKPFVPGGMKGGRGPRSNARLFFDALLWLARSGARWRDLPERFGSYEAAKQRYYWWVLERVFDWILEGVFTDPHFEWLAIDTIVVRAHAQAPGSRRKRGGGPQAQALGRSRGGFGTKIHAVVDALGLPIRFELGPGQENDMTPACDLIRDLPAERTLADRAYDANSLIDLIKEQGGEAVILSRRHRKTQRKTNWLVYKERWGVEGFFAKLKQWRRIATRYDKLAANFLGFVKKTAVTML